MKTIYVCSNLETLADGVIGDSQRYVDDIREAVSEVCRKFSVYNAIEVKSDGFFANWHGGKFYRAGETVGRNKFGYRMGNVATLELDPSDELIALVDLIDDALDAKLKEIGKLEDATDDEILS